MKRVIELFRFFLTVIFFCIIPEKIFSEYKYTVQCVDFGINTKSMQFYIPPYQGDFTMADGFGDYYHFNLNQVETQESNSFPRVFLKYNKLYSINGRLNLKVLFLEGGYIFEKYNFSGIDIRMGIGLNYKVFSILGGIQYSSFRYENTFASVKSAWSGDPGIYKDGSFYSVGSAVNLVTIGKASGLFGEVTVKLNRNFNLWFDYNINSEITFDTPKVCVDDDDKTLTLVNFLDNPGEKIKLTRTIGIGISYYWQWGNKYWDYY